MKGEGFMDTLSKVVLLWFGWLIFTALVMAEPFALLVFANRGIAMNFWQSAFAVSQELALPALAGIMGTYVLVRARERKKQSRLKEAP